MNYLVIPFRIEALVIQKDTPVSAPLANFKKLPWKDPSSKKVPFISDSVLHKPNDVVSLKKGVHLHFILPDHLGKSFNFGGKSDDSSGYRSLPNHWEIKRTGGGKPEKNWVVQSDHVFSERKDYEGIGNPTVIPVPLKDEHGAFLNERPYRFMGRQILKEEFDSAQDYESFEDIFQSDLTILGYGDPNFAVFYPNCLGSFGLLDDDFDSIPEAGDLTYSVIGCYSDSDKDVTKEFVSHFSGEDLSNAFENEFDLKVDVEIDPETFEGVILKSSILIDTNPSYLNSFSDNQRIDLDKNNLEFYIGNSSEETLSALISKRLDGDAIENEHNITQLLIDSVISGKLLDRSAKYLEEKHKSEFNRIGGGYHWKLSLNGNVKNTQLANDSLNDFFKLINWISNDNLIELNQEQGLLDLAKEQLKSYKNQLALDWHKYMQAEHNDGLQTIDPKVHLKWIKTLITFIEDTEKRVIKIKESIDKICSGIKNQIKKEIIFFDSGAKSASEFISLAQIPNSSFHTPSNPVILVNNLISSSYYKSTLDLNNYQVNSINSRSELDKIESFENKLGEQIWKPFLFEWSVSFFKSHLFDKNLQSLLDGFLLDEYGPDILINSSKYSEQNELKQEKVFNGTTILSGTSVNYVNEILNELSSRDQPEKKKKLINELQAEIPQIHILAQSLDGFNDAFINKIKSPQLPIMDPFETMGTREIIASIAKHLEDVPTFSLETDFYFTPIRSGSLTDFKFCFVDNFGLKSSIIEVNSHKATGLKMNKSYGFKTDLKNDDKVFLKPRLIQPSKIDFHWINQDGVSSYDLVHNNPICGWLVPNLLDNEMFVYDSNGKALGFINQKNEWNLPPSHISSKVNDISVIENQFLRDVVSELKKNITKALDVIQAAQNNISSEAQLQKTIGNTLLGRPVAVSRASFGIKIQGLPIIDNSNDTVENLNNSNWNQKIGVKWTDVKIPYRLGEHSQLNDGLIGYWFDNNTTLYAPQTKPQDIGEQTESDFELAVYEEGKELIHEKSISGQNVKMTILMDPFSIIHATSGILPVESIKLLPEWYQNALAKIEVWFKTGPIIQPNTSEIPNQNLFITLPKIKEFSWIWTDLKGENKDIKDFSDKPEDATVKLSNGYLSLKGQKNERN